MLGDPRLCEDDEGKAEKVNTKMPACARMTMGGTEDDDGGYLFASAASIAFASAIFSGETPSFSKTLMALDSPFFIKCSPKVSYPLFAMISGLSILIASLL